MAPDSYPGANRSQMEANLKLYPQCLQSVFYLI